MLFKKPAAVLASGNAFSSLTSTSGPGSPCLTSHVRNDRGSKHQRHSYATVRDDIQSPHSEDLAWPEHGTPPRPPSPYQIFHQKREDPYSKRRFYELVKLYHPDRSRHVEDQEGTPAAKRPSKAVMLERYRMVIAANTILSDPQKRDAYDRFGHGWAHLYGEDSVHGRYAYRYGTHHRWRTDGSAAYQWPVDQDPMYNATWEDWERWYRNQLSRRKPSQRFHSSFFTDRGRQGGVYTSNYAFVSVIFLLAALGGAGQATRANEGAKSRLQRAQIVNDETSKVLQEARQNTREQRGAGETKDDRIRRFLSQSEDYSAGELDGRVLKKGDDDLCAPGLVKDSNEPRFWQKPPENR